MDRLIRALLVVVVVSWPRDAQWAQWKGARKIANRETNATLSSLHISLQFSRCDVSQVVQLARAHRRVLPVWQDVVCDQPAVLLDAILSESL